MTRDSPSYPAVIVLIVLCCGVEALLWAADAGWVGSVRWRGLAYQNGAFWSGLLDNWQPNYPAQPWAMFVTYAFLHSGPGHLAGNMAMLFILGAQVCRRMGQGGLMLVYGVGALGGGLVFAALNRSPSPMVGASGALFGLAGALVFMEFVARRDAERSLRPVAGTVAFLVLGNAAMWLWLDGLLAWEAHLGGFLAGWLVASFWR